MGKLTVKEAEELVEQGILSKKALEEMQSSGLVSSRRHSTRRYMKTSDGKWVTPQLYFQGLGKDGNYSKKMAALKDEVTAIFEKYTTVKQKNGSNGS